MTSDPHTAQHETSRDVGVRLEIVTEGELCDASPAPTIDRSHLDAVDAAVARAFEQGHDEDARHLWHESPGRALLLMGVDLLPWLSGSSALAPFDLSPERVLAAARSEVHSLVPGKGFAPLAPVSDSVETAIVEMAIDTRCLARSASLAWLLDRMARDPFYDAADGVRRDLRHVLPPSIERAFFVHDDLDGEIRRESSMLEAAVLPHAVHLASRVGDEEHFVANAWVLAGWLSYGLARSPLRTGDLSVLAARVRSALSDDVQPSIDDALDPRRFDVGNADRVDLVEFAWLNALVWHLLDPPMTDPLPAPVTRYLQRLARREASPAERALEEALAAGHNALSWGAPHAAPTVAARWLLTRVRAPWLAEAPMSVFRESLRAMTDAPARHGWLATTLFLEGRSLSDVAVREARDAWRAPAAEGIPTHLRLSMAAGLTRTFEASDEERVLALLRACDRVWRPFVIDALLEGVDASRRSFSSALLGELQSLIDDGAIDRKIRLNAFVMALRRADADYADEALRAGLVRAGRQSPFAENAAIRRELSRLTHMGVRKIAG